MKRVLQVHVVVVGGGAAGSLLALMLAARGDASLKITLVDREASFGRGVAYSAKSKHHRINVPASKMGGIEPEQPTGFVDWLKAQQCALEGFSASFVPRSLFGDYLSEHIEALAQEGKVCLVQGDVHCLEKRADGSWRCVAGDAEWMADEVVLCTGNTPPAAPTASVSGGRWIANVWEQGALHLIEMHDHVAIVGTGATAIDALLELRERGHQGKVTMLSRHGLLPQIDVPSGAYPDFFSPLRHDADLRSALRSLRQEVQRAAVDGVPWQDVMDAFRVHAAFLWRKWPDSERRRFLRHVRATWMVHRHRLAPDVFSWMENMQGSGRLQVLAARVQTTKIDQRGVLIRYDARHGAADQTLQVDWALNCVGPSENFQRLKDPLWIQLFAQGEVRPGPLGLGLQVDDSLRLMNSQGDVQPHLYALGLPTRGQFWEVTAVVHIRQQACLLAEALAQSLRR